MQLLIQRGLKATEGQVINFQRAGDSPVISKVIDTERDDQVGISISKYNLNYVFQPKDPRDKLFKNVFPVKDVAQLPAKVDLAQDGWGTILDQGELGSCVSNSVAYCIRYVRQKEKLSVFDPSRLYIYYYGRLVEGDPIREDTGLYIRTGFQSVQKYSVCSERNWPYIIAKFVEEPNKYAQNAAKQHKTFQYLAVGQTLPELKSCLADGYPVSFGMTVFESFMSTYVATTGKVPVPKFDAEQQVGGHALTIIGYDDSINCFKIVNSWSDSWGEKGFCYIPYDYILNSTYVNDFWTPRVFV